MNHFLADSPVVPGSSPILPAWPELIIGTIAFLIVFAVLAKVLLPRIQKAEAAQAEANRTLDQYRAQLSEARHEAARLREEAKEQGAQIIAEMREQAQAEARRVTEAAQAQLAADRQQALAALRTEVGAISVELASKIVGESLSDEARQRRLVDRFLDELEAGRAEPAGTRTAGASGAQATS